MSVSNNHILEISMIKELINNSSKNDETKHNLIEVLETIIKVADTIIEWEDYINPDDYKHLASSTSSGSDSDYTPSP